MHLDTETIETKVRSKFTALSLFYVGIGASDMIRPRHGENKDISHVVVQSSNERTYI